MRTSSAPDMGPSDCPCHQCSLSTPALVAAQYQGFLYGSGGPVSLTQTGPGFSLIGSFGYSNLQAACPTLPAPATATILYGGEFANNDPSSNASGNCDLAFDLGTQDGKQRAVSGSEGLRHRWFPNERHQFGLLLSSRCHRWSNRKEVRDLSHRSGYCRLPVAGLGNLPPPIKLEPVDWLLGVLDENSAC